MNENCVTKTNCNQHIIYEMSKICMSTICNHNALNMLILQYFVVYSSQYWELQNTSLSLMNKPQTYRGHAFSATLNYMLATIPVPLVSGCSLQLRQGKHGYEAC